MARVEQSIEINVPTGAAWDMLARVEQFPRFMQEVEEVRRVDDTHLRWRTRGLHWDAEITQQVPGQCIAWRNLDEPGNSGRIALEPVDGDRTRVTLTLEREATHAEAVEHVEQDLVRMKHFVEKLARDSGNWRGREQDGKPSHTAAAEKAAGVIDQDATQFLHASASVAEQADAPQQAFGADEADNARGGAGLHRSGHAARAFSSLFAQRLQDPLSTMRRMSDNVEQAVTALAAAAGLMRGREPAPGTWLPRIETVEDAQRFLACFELPGVARDDIVVEIHDGQLIVEGVRSKPQNVAEAGRRCTEFRYGRFHRAVMLPANADTGAVSAELRSGVLQVTVLRHPAAVGAGRIAISED